MIWDGLKEPEAYGAQQPDFELSEGRPPVIDPPVFDYQAADLTEFPVLDVSDVGAVTAGRGAGLAPHPDNPYYVQSAIARRDGDRLAPGVLVRAFERLDRHPDFFDLTAYERRTIDGRTVGVSVSPGEAPGSGPFTSVVIDPDGDTPIVVDGTDPLGFLDDVGLSFAYVFVARSDEGLIPVDLTLHLSSDYVVVVEPQPSALGTQAVTLSTGTLNSHGEPSTFVSVGVEPYYLALDVKDRRLEPVDVAGRKGWRSCNERRCRVSWTTLAGTNVTLDRSDTPEKTLAFAASITFVDRAEWESRYS